MEEKSIKEKIWHVFEIPVTQGMKINFVGTSA